PEELRINRIVLRDRVSEEVAISKIRSQMPEEEKLKYADYIINNNELSLLVEQCMDIHSRLLFI
ncbi:MAG: dephospho-CoA kinase, partial [Saprospiraceae bacterium]|nr:dephospho-CoA kinase [Saprospiraceae bacterium]